MAKFEAGVWSVFFCCGFVEVEKLNLGRDSEARFGQYLELGSLTLIEMFMFN